MRQPGHARGRAAARPAAGRARRRGAALSARDRDAHRGGLEGLPRRLGARRPRPLRPRRPRLPGGPRRQGGDGLREPAARLPGARGVAVHACDAARPRQLGRLGRPDELGLAPGRQCRGAARGAALVADSPRQRGREADPGPPLSRLGSARATAVETPRQPGGARARGEPALRGAPPGGLEPPLREGREPGGGAPRLLPERVPDRLGALRRLAREHRRHERERGAPLHAAAARVLSRAGGLERRASAAGAVAHPGRVGRAAARERLRRAVLARRPAHRDPQRGGRRARRRRDPRASRSRLWPLRCRRVGLDPGLGAGARVGTRGGQGLRRRPSRWSHDRWALPGHGRRQRHGCVARRALRRAGGLRGRSL